MGGNRIRTILLGATVLLLTRRAKVRRVGQRGRLARYEHWNRSAAAVCAASRTLMFPPANRRYR